MSGFDPIIVDLEEKIENPGDSYSLSGHVDAVSYVSGEKELELEDGISFDVVLTNAGDGVLVTGIVRAGVNTVCDRCLDPAHFDVAGEIDEYFLFEEPEDPEEFEDGFELVSADHTIDLSDAVADAVVMDTPFVVLCRPDCAGLCPTCGANLNHESCDCASKKQKEWTENPDNPFAALKDLKLDD